VGEAHFFKTLARAPGSGKLGPVAELPDTPGGRGYLMTDAARISSIVATTVSFETR
jgi:hypothetical protein